MIALVTLNLRLGDIEGLMNICLPFMTLEPVMDKLNTKYWYSSIKKDNEEEYTEAIQSLISRAPVPIKAHLGKSTPNCIFQGNNKGAVTCQFHKIL